MLLYSAVVFLISSSVALEQPVAETYLGNVYGYHKTSYDGRIYSAFEGIPYAHPPVGKLRFEEPVEISSWKQTLHANRTYACSQIYESDEVSGTEDCLYLNVYVPRDNPDKNDKLDVIVFIHGGEFTGGSSAIAGPGFLMDREVIFVNLNYRVGVLGFLSTEDDVVPGNNGLKDQVMALKWIQNHIKQFGGNPKSITIAGSSTGGICVHLHYFSKLSEGLFHRGISQSGNVFTPVAYQRDALERVKALAVLVGCSDVTNNRILIDCMKKKFAKDILEKVPYLKVDSPNKDFPHGLFAPVVEKKSTTSFLIDYPYNLLLNKKFYHLPWMASICTEEGDMQIKSLNRDLDTLDNKFDKWAHYYLCYNYTACVSDREFIAREIREQYFGKLKMGRDTIKRITKLFGDRLFTNSFEKSVRLQTSVTSSKVYSYVYGYKNSFSNDLMKSEGIDLDTGVYHTEDNHLIYYVYSKGRQINANLSRDDEKVKNMMIDMFVSFANSSIPTINGFSVLPVRKSEEIAFVYIKSPTEVYMNVTEEFTPTKFWNSLPIIELEKFPKESCRKKRSNSNTFKSNASVITGKRNITTILALATLFPPLLTTHFLLYFKS